jgi:hypothetical protein
MNWLDVAGPPGSGKSTLCDAIWGPHDLPIENRLPPAAWHDFLNEITRLFHLIKPHPTFPAALRMVNRSVRKIATVARMPGGSGGIDLRVDDPLDTGARYNLGAGAACPRGPYIQTGLAQRGLGFGWRLNDMGRDLNELRHYFRLMPVSLGVAITRCPPEVVEQRNHARKLVPATAHEDRAHMVRLMQPAIEIAIEVLRERGVYLIEVDTSGSVDEARARLVEFAGARSFIVGRSWAVDSTPADAETHNPPALGHSPEVEVLSPPPWWQ